MADDSSWLELEAKDEVVSRIEAEDVAELLELATLFDAELAASEITLSKSSFNDKSSEIAEMDAVW